MKTKKQPDNVRLDEVRSILAVGMDRFLAHRLETLRNHLLRGSRVLCGMRWAKEEFVWNGYADPIALSFYSGFAHVPVRPIDLPYETHLSMTAVLANVETACRRRYRSALALATRDDVVAAAQQACELRGIEWTLPRELSRWDKSRAPGFGKDKPREARFTDEKFRARPVELIDEVDDE